MIDVMEELFKFTLLLRGNMNYLVTQYSEEITVESQIIKPSAESSFESAEKSLAS